LIIEFLHSIDLIFFIYFILGFISLFYLYKILSHKKWYKLLLALRLISILILILLLLNPVINISSKSNKELIWNIFLDNSSSIKYHKTPSINSIKSGVLEFMDKLKEKNISFNTFVFDNNISQLGSSNFNGNGISTNIGKVFDSIIDQSNNSAGTILISDGIITEGKNSIEGLASIRAPIHVIGIGEKSELVDISIHSIDVPTVVLKGDKINLKVIIQSLGSIKERLSISLYRDSQLLGSKPIQLLGLGSKNETNFQFSANEIGRQNYEIRVSSVKDEVNIKNNRQNFSLLVLKDQYKVALITGSPNKNTSKIKTIIKQNKRIKLDHFILINDNEFKPNFKKFWESPYELIIFDNYPIQPLSPNIIRVLGKKIISNQSGLMHLTGPNQNTNSLNRINAILGIALADSSITSEKVFWEFIEGNNDYDIEFPPLVQSLYLIGNSVNSDSLAIFESGWPLWIRNKKNNFRSVVFATSELNVLYHFRKKESNNDLLSLIINKEVNWLLKTDSENENYFRLNKDSFQQGELIKISGTQPFDDSNFKNSISFNIIKDNNKIYNGNLEYNYEKNRWEGDFRASSPGSYLFELFIDKSETPAQIGKFIVLESQIELTQVYLNKELLNAISKNTNGKYYHWDDRNELNKIIFPKVHHELKAEIIKLTESRLVLIILIFILCIEWTIRRFKGLI